MKKQFYYAALTVVALLTFTGCSNNDDDELVGNWVKISDFEGVARSGAVVFKINEVVYVGTGINNKKERLNDIWRYNESNDTWTQVVALDAFEMPLRNYAVAFGAGNAGYIGLGNDTRAKELGDFWKYSPADNSLTRVADFTGGARYSAVAFSLNGYGYVGTGYDGNHLKDFWKYDPAADSWTQIESIPGSKRYGASVFMIDNKAYIVGGFNNGSGVNDFHVFDGNNWSTLRKIANVSDESYDDDYNIVRGYAAAFTIDGKGYLAAGASGSGSIRSDVWEYDPVTDLWEERTSFEGYARSEALGFNVGGRGFVLTGASSSLYFDDVYEFFPTHEYDEYD